MANQLNREHFLPLKETIACLPIYRHDPIWGEKHIFPEYPGSAAMLRDNPELLEKTAGILEEKGFRRFRFLEGGAFAAMLKTTEGQLIGLRHPKEPPRPELPFVLGVQDSFAVKSGTDILMVEVLPALVLIEDRPYFSYIKAINSLRHAAFEAGYVDTGVQLALEIGFTNEDAVNYAYGRLEGPELQQKNMAALDADVPLILDGGALIHLDALKGQQDTSPIREMVRGQLASLRASSTPEIWVQPDGVWKQHAKFPEIATKDRRNVLSDTELERLSQLEGNRSLVDAVRRDGRYRSEVGAILMDAAADGGNETEAEFEKRILEERAARPTTRNPDYNSGRKR